MRNPLTGLLLVLLISSSVFALQSSGEKVSLGAIDGSTYANSYFGFKLQIPDQWQVQDSEAKKALREQGKQMVSGDDKGFKAIIDASLLNTLDLLMVFKYPVGSPVESNPGFGCVAEKVRHLPGIKKGSDYLFHVKKLFERVPGEREFQDTYSEQIDGADFDVLEVKTKLGPVTLRQKYYSAIVKGYALNFIFTYGTDEDLKSLNEILKSIRFQP